MASVLASTLRVYACPMYLVERLPGVSSCSKKQIFVFTNTLVDCLFYLD